MPKACFAFLKGLQGCRGRRPRKGTGVFFQGLWPTGTPLATCPSQLFAVGQNDRNFASQKPSELAAKIVAQLVEPGPGIRPPMAKPRRVNPERTASYPQPRQPPLNLGGTTDIDLFALRQKSCPGAFLFALGHTQILKGE